MSDHIQVIIENAKKDAEVLINNTVDVRKGVAKGRPNSSPESTVDGTLKVFAELVSGFNPGYTLK